MENPADIRSRHEPDDVPMMYHIVISLWLLLGIVLSVAAEAPSGDMTVRVDGFESDNGAVVIGLFISEETYDADQGGGEEDSKQAYQSVTTAVHDGRAEHVFEQLPYGEYALKLYHDENGNGKLDRNFIGIPKESYGFSNNPRTFAGPASYRQALFEFKVPDHTLTIHLKH